MVVPHRGTMTSLKIRYPARLRVESRVLHGPAARQIVVASGGNRHACAQSLWCAVRGEICLSATPPRIALLFLARGRPCIGDRLLEAGRIQHARHPECPDNEGRRALKAK